MMYIYRLDDIEAVARCKGERANCTANRCFNDGLGCNREFAPLFARSSLHLFARSSLHLFARSSLHLFARSLMHLFARSLMHLFARFPYGLEAIAEPAVYLAAVRKLLVLQLQY
jgi:hypothetical protein